MKVLIVALVLMLSVLISGCAPKVHVDPIVQQEIFLEYCSEDMPVLKNFTIDSDGNRVYNGAEVLRVLDEWALFYTKCAVTHDGLVNLVSDLQAAKQTKPTK